MWATLPTLVCWAVEPGLGLRPHISQREHLQLSHPSGTSASACGSQASPFLISALPTSFSVASFVNPWSYGFSSASLELVIQVDCSVLVVLPVWSSEEVSVASTYFVATLDLKPPSFFQQLFTF